MGKDQTSAYAIDGAQRKGRYLITCDHASNHVPDWVAGGDLGIAPQDMARHIAYDVGAAGVARGLGALLGSPVICSNFSRLVIDPNRGLDDPTLIMQLYDGTIIPANRHLTPAQVQARIDLLYRPYHAALAELAAQRQNCVIVAIHSYTPCLRGRAPRPWHVGVLFDPRSDRFSRALLEQLHKEADLCIGENEPYAGHLHGDAIYQHALQKGRDNTLIEIRNDLITTAEQQKAWANRLATMLQRAQSCLPVVS
ncbi:MAG: N-formylglutamate amidohydrolase [Cypionkella sp.]|nr:N-formylglutamate amidohydrolase [Cypionkella sp.]